MFLHEDYNNYSLQALDMFWHEDCLKCGCCDCRLGEVGHTLYTKGNLLLCKRDYLRLFGSTGYCAACNKVTVYRLIDKILLQFYYYCAACNTVTLYRLLR